MQINGIRGVIEVTNDDIWNYNDVIITTNGYVSKNGEAVMGRGIAYEAKKNLICAYHDSRFCKIEKVLASRLSEEGNVPMYLGHWENKDTEKVYRIWTFPTKHHWQESSDIELIVNSAILIKDLVEAFEVHMPRPGCGNGRLNWSVVRPQISHILDNRFIVHGGK